MSGIICNLCVGKLKRVQINMVGGDAWRDDVLIEQSVKSVKYEEVQLHAYNSVAAAKDGA